MSESWTTERCFVSLALLALLATPAHAAQASPSTKDGDGCHQARPLALNQSSWHDQAPGSGAAFFSITLPSAGALAVDLSTTAAAGRGPTLTVLSAAERPLTDEHPTLEILHAGSQGTLLYARERQALCLAVSPNDLAVDVTLRIRTVFEEAPWQPDAVSTIRGNPPASCDVTTAPTFDDDGFGSTRYVAIDRPVLETRDVEPEDCDILDGAAASPGVWVFESSGTPLAATLFEGRHCARHRRIGERSLGQPETHLAAAVFPGSHRLVLDPVGHGPVAYVLNHRRFDVCASARSDDHADSPWCASPIVDGEPTTGVAGDQRVGSGLIDRDHFTFVVDARQRIGFDVVGAIAVDLFDRLGQRLDVERTSPPSIEVTLTPGRYFLQATASSDTIEPYSIRRLVEVEP